MTHRNLVLMLVSLLMNFAVDWPTPKIPWKHYHGYNIILIIIGNLLKVIILGLNIENFLNSPSIIPKPLTVYQYNIISMCRIEKLLTPLPEDPPDNRLPKKTNAPMSSRVGSMLRTRFWNQAGSAEYVTGMWLAGSMPSSRWACSKLRSKESTLPMLKVR